MSAHSTHCCKVHGCKYGDDDCPVVLGTDPGVIEDWCEHCQDDKYDPRIQELKKLKEENAKMREIIEWIATVNATDYEYQEVAKNYLHQLTFSALKD